MTDQTQIRRDVEVSPSAAKATGLLVGRVALVGAASVAVWLVFVPTGATAFPPSPLFGALAMLLVLADPDAAGDFGVRDTADKILPPIEPLPATSG